MLALLAVLGSLALGLTFIVFKHIYVYLRDAKGLRKFPGMTPLAPFTNLPYMYVASQGRRYRALYEAHAKLGPIVRVGPNSVSFNDIKGVKDIYGHGTPTLKDPFYDVQAGSHRHLADVSDKADHSRKRRVLAAAFSQAGLESWEHIVADRTGALIDQYDRLCEYPEYYSSPHVNPGETDPKLFKGFINHRQWMAIFAEDAIAQIGLSADLHMLEKGHDNVEIVDMKGNKSVVSYRASLWYQQRLQSCFVWSTDWFSMIQKLTAWHSGWWHNDNFNGIVVHLTRERLKRYQAGEKLDDFFTHLFEDKKGNPNLYPMGELAAEASIMLNAGSDTTGIALTNVVYWLLKHPKALAKLQAELDGVLDVEDKVAPFDSIKHLPYLRACLDESMRMTPPNTMNLPRITPPEGLNVMGHWIPGGTTVSSGAYAMHRNPEIFPNAESYIPERWLGEEGKDRQAYFLTFSAGARGCIGRNITYLEQTVALATLVFRYDMELLRPDWVLRQEETFTCSPGDMPLKISRRHPSKAQ